MGLLCTFNVVLPWDCTKSRETFQTEDIQLEAPEESLNFQDWEHPDYGLELRMDIFAYREEIISRKASFRRIQRHNTYLLGSQLQFSFLTTLETYF